jgi:hypothetical protein
MRSRLKEFLSHTPIRRGEIIRHENGRMGNCVKKRVQREIMIKKVRI